MRRCPKYKIYSSNISAYSSIVTYPSRMSKFNRPKWVKLKRALKNTTSARKNKNKKLLRFSSFDIVRKPLKSFNKLKTYYSRGMSAKRMLRLVYDHAFKMQIIQKQIHKLRMRRDIHLAVYGRYFHRLDILLTYTGFSASPYAARQKIQEGVVFVNGVKVFKPIFLNGGDLVEYKGASILKQLNLLKTLRNIVYTSIECDYYSNSIFILKDLTRYNTSDLSYLSFHRIDVKAIKDL